MWALLFLSGLFYFVFFLKYFSVLVIQPYLLTAQTSSRWKQSYHPFATIFSIYLECVLHNSSVILVMLIMLRAIWLVKHKEKCKSTEEEEEFFRVRSTWAQWTERFSHARKQSEKPKKDRKKKTIKLGKKKSLVHLTRQIINRKAYTSPAVNKLRFFLLFSGQIGLKCTRTLLDLSRFW